jgi:hypothetical protein
LPGWRHKAICVGRPDRGTIGPARASRARARSVAGAQEPTAQETSRRCPQKEDWQSITTKIEPQIKSKPIGMPIIESSTDGRVGSPASHLSQGTPASLLDSGE